MIGIVQFKHVLDKLTPIFNERALLTAQIYKDVRPWVSRFNILTSNEKLRLIELYFEAQGLAIIKQMNTLKPDINVPHFGKFRISATNMYMIHHEEEMNDLPIEERRAILKALFGKNYVKTYNPDIHYEKISIDPTTAKRTYNIL